ncbi:MAG: hypothetical protein QXK12_03200 [Candidatus Nezhaarchaeales archaeon]
MVLGLHRRSVKRYRQQVLVALGTPDPYLALLFKEVFAKYGHVGVAPYRNSENHYMWRLWVLLPLKSFQYLLEKRIPAPLNDDEKLYSALSITIDCEGSVYAQNPKGRRAASFAVAFYNEKAYVIEPLYETLKQRRYGVKLYTTPKGKEAGHDRYSNDYYHSIVHAKAHVKRLLENVEPGSSTQAA